MAMRGQLTQQIKDYSKKRLGYEMDTTELRLIPYVLTVMMDDQEISPRRCNQADREILSKWRKKNYIEGGASGLKVSKKFWEIICEVVFMGYVDID